MEFSELLVRDSWSAVKKLHDFSGYFLISITLFFLPNFHDFSMIFHDMICFHAFPGLSERWTYLWYKNHWMISCHLCWTSHNATACITRRKWSTVISRHFLRPQAATHVHVPTYARTHKIRRKLLSPVNSVSVSSRAHMLECTHTHTHVQAHTYMAGVADYTACLFHVEIPHPLVLTNIWKKLQSEGKLEVGRTDRRTDGQRDSHLTGEG